MSGALASDQELSPELRTPPAQEYIRGNHELPIAQYRPEIEDALRHNSVTILLGKTGSGKSTQVPQYAVEMRDENGDRLFNAIIHTQPRIVAARSISERLNVETSEVGVSDGIGYYTGKESSPIPQRDQDVALLTDGKAAAQLLHRDFTQKSDKKELWIIDEGHEMNIPIEMLLALAHKVTNPKLPDGSENPEYSPNVRVLVMSATINTEKLQEYFEHAKPPVINVPVSTYPVASSTDGRVVSTVAGEIAEKSGAKVLTFLPGKREIIKMAQDMKKRRPGVSVVPLHAQQVKKDQDMALRPYSKGVVVATTPVAETSLTVPDAVAVVDSGLARIDRIGFNSVETGSEGLFLEDAAQENLDQRKGRVGRTQAGRYVLASAVKYENRAKYAVPAMERVRLDGMMLDIKSSGRKLSDFTFYNQPPKLAINAARDRLYNFGAINRSGKVTERGEFMSSLPLDPEYACMIAFAKENCYGEEVIHNLIDIVAIMQPGGLFSRSPKEQRWRELLHTDAAGEPKEQESDFFAQLEGYVALTHINRKQWMRYDVNEYLADFVERDRQEIARRMGMKLNDVDVVLPHNRHDVKMCINAGQVNQIWQSHSGGEKWSLLVGGRNERYEQAKSSVLGPVDRIGRLATGSHFTLGLGEKELQMVQNLNTTDRDTLLKIASHLATEVVNEGSTYYDHDKRELVAKIDKKLGNFVIAGVYEKSIPTPVGSPARELLNISYLEHIWDEWSKANKFDSKEYDDYEKLRDVVTHPEFAVYGHDLFDETELYAWKCANGKWTRDQKVAITSIEAALRRMGKPRKQNTRHVKRDLRRMHRRGKITTSEIVALEEQAGKSDSPNWAAAASALINSKQNTKGSK